MKAEKTVTRRLVIDIEYTPDLLIHGFRVGDPQDWNWHHIFQDYREVINVSAIGSYEVLVEDFACPHTGPQMTNLELSDL